MEDCHGPLHPAALEGLRLFNRGEYFEAHEALEEAWRAEKGAIRDLYRGILQIAVVYLHITRNNYHGAVKVYGRSQKWIRDWPASCRGIQVGQLRKDSQTVLAEVQRLGPEGLKRFDVSLIKPIDYEILGPIPPADRED
jgi:predicted metal-dependent hydrolase